MDKYKKYMRKIRLKNLHATRKCKQIGDWISIEYYNEKGEMSPYIKAIWVGEDEK